MTRRLSPIKSIRTWNKLSSFLKGFCETRSILLDDKPGHALILPIKQQPKSLKYYIFIVDAHRKSIQKYCMLLLHEIGHAYYISNRRIRERAKLASDIEANEFAREFFNLTSMKLYSKERKMLNDLFRVAVRCSDDNGTDSENIGRFTRISQWIE